jgi:pimeloyl-ACP methyl ester carboxylesterase
MSLVTSVTAANETPIFFPGGSETLFGIMTRPGAPNGTGFLILSGGATPITPNRNRLSVRLCRQLAGNGFLCLRFDYHGAGESTGAVEALDLAEPHLDDTLAAVEMLRQAGASRIVVAGSCFGSRNALAVSRLVPELTGVVLLAMPLRDNERGSVATIAGASLTTGQSLRRAMSLRTIKNLFDRRRRRVYVRFLRERIASFRDPSRGATHGAPATAGNEVTSSLVLRSLEELRGRGVSTLVVYGTEDEYFGDFTHDRDGRLGRILEADNFDVRILPAKVHGFPQLAIQTELIEMVSDWLEPVGSRAASAGAPVDAPQM